MLPRRTIVVVWLLAVAGLAAFATRSFETAAQSAVPKTRISPPANRAELSPAASPHPLVSKISLF